MVDKSPEKVLKRELAQAIKELHSVSHLADHFFSKARGYFREKNELEKLIKKIKSALSDLQNAR